MEAIADKLVVLATDEGPTDVGREGEFRNLRIELHNRSDKTIWVRALKTLPISDYLRSRNPDGICYEIERHQNIWRNADAGLSGTPSDAQQIVAQSSLGFIAPIPVNEPIRGSEIRATLTLYRAANAANGMRFSSNAVPIH